jgi:ATP-dependent exoDNAse (exonuclease V) alpha subunit
VHEVIQIAIPIFHVLALKKEKSVAITSTTGVASYQLGFGATTLHHWSGIRDGRLTVDELNRYFLLDEQFEEARHRIRSAQTLVIDEIGMLSELILEKVEQSAISYSRPMV